MKRLPLLLLLMLWFLSPLSVFAEVQTLTGKVVSVISGPSNPKLERTTRGIHLIVLTTEPTEGAVEPLPNTVAAGKTVNLHLGPEVWLKRTLHKIPRQQPLTFKVFKTAALPKEHYLVQSIETKDTVYQFRDGAMKPLWANKR